MRTQAAGECFHSFFEFSQTFARVSITQYRNMENMFSISFRKHYNKKGKQLIFAHTIIISTARVSSVFLTSYRNVILTNQREYFLRAVF